MLKKSKIAQLIGNQHLSQPVVNVSSINLLQASCGGDNNLGSLFRGQVDKCLKTWRKQGAGHSDPKEGDDTMNGTRQLAKKHDRLIDLPLIQYYIW